VTYSAYYGFQFYLLDSFYCRKPIHARHKYAFNSIF